MALLATLGGCIEPASFVIENRSDSTIALLPGIVAPPCSRIGFTSTQIEDGQEAWAVALDENDETWVPAGAVRFTRGSVGPRIGAPKPQTLIISGTEEPRLIDGPAPGGALPACGGSPLGIS